MPTCRGKKYKDMALKINNNFKFGYAYAFILACVKYIFRANDSNSGGLMIDTP